MRHVVKGWLLVGLVAALAACAQGSPGAGLSSAPPPMPEVTPTIGPGGVSDEVTFTPCPRATSDPSRTHLQPQDAPADPRTDGEMWAQRDGPLLVEDAGDLLLVDGLLGVDTAGAVFDGRADGHIQVASTTVTVPITLQVLDSAYSGRRVTFVEAQISPDEPARWESADDLWILTDGGDGGYLAPADAVRALDALAMIEPSVEAMHRDDGVCAHRRSWLDGPVDAVLFPIGGGDGLYPTYLGRDSDGDLVSVVTWGDMTPWTTSGLPGTPPPDVDG
ncbi:hypothetical protein [Cellulomonas oligotrophica]|uniref:DUF4241 domain-containing protein n=1 Tax=Cellulomonas oligotrophica TaxID=931536 RepID=A0A7Y9FGK5_9CELL|nr:hypothetical protein [Cellulomonas oligotrophica]GIG32411.1 hypothetical protein Col01nite_15700 [Cellulomonas oligotrophica]